MIQPAFTDDGRLIGFVANILHHTDVGGMRPGSQAVEGVFDYFQEGLHVPPVKPWKGGEEQEDILAIILANTRMAGVDAGRPARPAELAARGRAAADRAGAPVRPRDGPGGDGRDHGPDRGQGARGDPRRSRTATYPFEDFMDDSGPGTAADAPRRDGHRPRRRHPDRLRRHRAPDRVGDELLHQLHALVLLRRGEVPDRSRRPAERRRLPARCGSRRRSAPSSTRARRPAAARARSSATGSSTR